MKENGGTNQRQNKIENDMVMEPRNRSLPRSPGDVKMQILSQCTVCQNHSQLNFC